MSIKATKVRYGVIFMLFITVIVNYMDRSNISIAAPFLTKELGLDSVKMGLIFSAFGWTYCVLQIPEGAKTIAPDTLFFDCFGLMFYYNNQCGPL